VNVKYCQGAADSVRVPQNKEPAHFLSIFPGLYVVHKGSAYEVSDTRLYQVRGTEIGNTKTIGINPRAENLNSNYCFLATTKDIIYVWRVQYSHSFSKEISDKLALRIKGARKVEVVVEGKEDNQFWALLGGKAPYDTLRIRVEPKLFLCENPLGHLKCHRIFDFAQEDLTDTKWKSSKLAILDTFDQVYVWIGSQMKNEKNKQLALLTATEYMEKDTNAVRLKNPVQVIEESHEPIHFRAAFTGWIEKESVRAIKEAVVADDLLKEYDKTYTQEQLQDKANLPATVDRGRLEAYLSNAEFARVFGMDKAAFFALPTWRSLQLKKEAGFF